MQITYSKQYHEQQAVNFTFFSDFSHKTPNVFWQYKDLLTFCFFATKEEIKQKIKEFKPKAKSKCVITYTDDGIEFYKPSKSVFPEMYILWKSKNYKI
jgi:hypothetical protein